MRFCFSRKLAVLAICLVLTSVQAGETALADFPELLKQVPHSANALILIKTKDIEAKATTASGREIHNFQEAARFWPIIERWKPERVVVAAEMDIQHMTPQWEMAAIDFAQQPDLAVIAKSVNGVKDEVSGCELIWLENACILATGDNQLTLVTPLNRQSAARWLNRVKQQNSAELSPFLTEVAGTATSDTTDITLTVDLENVLPPSRVGELVKSNPLFEKIETDPTKILSGLRGVVIQCQCNSKQPSTISFDFSDSVEALAPIAKPLMIGALAKAGAMPDQLSTWKSKADGKRLLLQGNMSPTGLRRVLTLASIGAVVAHADAVPVEQTEAADPPGDQKAADEMFSQLQIVRATKKYFKSVNEIVTEISQGFDRKGLDQNALWINNYARKIDMLSTRQVDKAMIEYGQYVSKALGSLVGNFHQANDQVRANMNLAVPVFGERTVSAVPMNRYSYGGHRRTAYAPMVTQRLNVGYARQDRRAIRDIGRYDANQVAYDILGKIDEATSNIRKSMSEKYKTEF